MNSPSSLNRNKWATDDGWFACTHRQTASASKYCECRPSMMTISWCLSKKHSTADSGVRAMLHLNPACSHAHQNASLWLSSLAKTSNTWARQRRREREVLLVGACERSTVFHPVQRCVTMSCDVKFHMAQVVQDASVTATSLRRTTVQRHTSTYRGRVTSPAHTLTLKHISTDWQNMPFSQVSEMWKNADI